MCPRTANTFSCNPKGNHILLLIGSHWVVYVLLLWSEGIYITSLEELQVRILAVDVMCNTLKTSEEKRLAHHIKVRTQRVEYLNQVTLRITIESLVICALCE